MLDIYNFSQRVLHQLTPTILLIFEYLYRKKRRIEIKESPLTRRNQSGNDRQRRFPQRQGLRYSPPILH